MRIVCIGGGTGLPVLLRGLRQRPAVTLTAMVCVSDNGGSSGRLRKAFGIPAVGDLRNCLVALADETNALAELFQYRLPGDENLGGHAVGNVIMTALLLRNGNLREAVRRAGELMQSTGRVLPATEIPTTLCAKFEETGVVRGETEITRQGRRIQRVWLEPSLPEPTPGLVSAIRAADMIVLGPGSLYTSIVPNLLVGGVPAAIRESGALTVLVSNLMTQPGESDEYTAADHLSAVEDYLGAGTVHFCVVNSRRVQNCRLARYRNASARPVDMDAESIARRGTVPVSADLLDENSLEVRHDSRKLARVIAALWKPTLVPGPAMKPDIGVQDRLLCAAS